MTCPVCGKLVVDVDGVDRCVRDETIEDATGRTVLRVVCGWFRWRA